MMNTEQWLENILSVVRDLADAEYQDRVWVRGTGQQVDSLTEAYCRLFDDYRLDDFISLCTEKKLITDMQRSVLFSLRNKLNEFKYDEDLTDEEIIRDPRWQSVRELSKGVLSKIP